MRVGRRAQLLDPVKSLEGMRLGRQVVCPAGRRRKRGEVCAHRCTGRYSSAAVGAPVAWRCARVVSGLDHFDFHRGRVKDVQRDGEAEKSDEQRREQAAHGAEEL